MWYLQKVPYFSQAYAKTLAINTRNKPSAPFVFFGFKNKVKHLFSGDPVLIFTTSRKDEIVILHQETKSKDKTAYQVVDRQVLGTESPQVCRDRALLAPQIGAACTLQGHLAPGGVGGGPREVPLGSEPSVSREQLAEGWAVGMNPPLTHQHFHIPLPSVSKPCPHRGPVPLGYFMAFFFLISEFQLVIYLCYMNSKSQQSW